MIRYIRFLIFPALLLLPAYAAAPAFVQPLKEKVPAFSSSIRPLYAQPLFYLEAGDVASVAEDAKGKLKIIMRDGRTGWIDKSLVKRTRVSKEISFDPKTVEGYIDTKNPLFIIAGEEAEDNPLVLNRSFANSLEENVDKESIERSVSP